MWSHKNDRILDNFSLKLVVFLFAFLWTIKLYKSYHSSVASFAPDLTHSHHLRRFHLLNFLRIPRKNIRDFSINFQLPPASSDLKFKLSSSTDGKHEDAPRRGVRLRLLKLNNYSVIFVALSLDALVSVIDNCRKPPLIPLRIGTIKEKGISKRASPSASAFFSR